MAAHVVTVLPPSEEGRISDMGPIAKAAEEARFYTEESGGKVVCEVNVFTDKELKREVVEIVGPEIALNFSCRCGLPFLVLHLRDIGKFVVVDVDVVDRAHKVRRIRLTNRQSVARIAADKASIPLVLVRGWNYVCLDLVDLADKAFGVEYAFCSAIAIHSDVRVGAVFFEDRQYEDRQLPECLRVVRT